MEVVRVAVAVAVAKATDTNANAKKTIKSVNAIKNSYNFSTHDYKPQAF